MADNAGKLWTGYLLNQLALRIRTATAGALHPIGITPPQLRVVEALADHAPISQARLGEIVHFDRTTIVHLIDRLETLGIAARTVDRADRRSHAVVLTAEGRDILDRARIAARAAEADFLQPLSGDERATLHTLLARLFDPEPDPDTPPVPDRRPKPIPCPEERL